MPAEDADERITETIKWKSPTFMYEGKLARYARFADLESVEAGRDELTSLVGGWCRSKERR